MSASPSIIIYQPKKSLQISSENISHEIQVRIREKFLHSQLTDVLARHLWGTDIYTQDSDIVAGLLVD